MNMLKKFLAVTALLLTIVPAAVAGQLSIGGEFVGWNSNYVQPFNGWELWAPLSLSFNVDPGLSFYGQTEYGKGDYTDSTSGSPNTVYLNGFSDSVVGTELSFKSFDVPSILNIGVNIPTGDTTWEGKQIAASIPTNFIDSRYRGRGFGVSGMYGVAIPAGSAQIGAAAGYSHAGTFDPSANNPGSSASNLDQLNLGDAVFVAFNHVQPFSDNQSQVIRLSGFYFLQTQQDNQPIYQAGPNINASYSWQNPNALSFDLGAQYYMPGQRQINGAFTTEPNISYGARLYLNPSYVMGDITLAAQAKYILPNGYAQGDTLYNDGGYLLGIEPSYRLKLDDSSAFKIYAGYDFVAALNAGPDANGNLTNVYYNNWTFGTNYEVKL